MVKRATLKGKKLFEEAAKSLEKEEKNKL